MPNTFRVDSTSFTRRAVSCFACIAAAAWGVAADHAGTLIFQDDFERSESQEVRDEPGNGWGTNSKSRAKGHKQVDLRNGAMYIFTHAEADHAASVTHPAEFNNGTVRIRFMPRDQGAPLKVRSVCLPFVLVKSPTATQAMLDLRTCQLARLDHVHAKRAWKAFKKNSRRNKAAATVQPG